MLFFQTFAKTSWTALVFLRGSRSFGTRLPGFKPKERAAGLITLCCSLEKRDHCFHAAFSSTDVHPPAALQQLYLGETSHLLLVPNLSLCLKHSSFLRNSVVENDLRF